MTRRPLIITHGIVRDAGHMADLADYCEQRGHRVFNIAYQWRTDQFQNILDEMSAKINDALATLSAEELALGYDIVGHSMGGLVTRGLLAEQSIPLPKRVLLLGTPNKGSEAIDKFTKVPILYMIYGPLALANSTKEVAVWRTFPERLPEDVEVGVIAGNKSLSKITKWLLPRPNDGKVTIASTHIDGETDHIVLPIYHDEMYESSAVFKVCVDFLDNGSFQKTRESLDWKYK